MPFVIGVLAVLGIAIAAIIGLASHQPDTFEVERSTTIAAPRSEVFARMSDLRAMQEWSPWDRVDPDMERTYSGAETGVGSVYQWKGNRKVGEGRMEITSITPESEIDVDLQFLKPFKAHNTVQYRLEQRGDQTAVSWIMKGESNPMSKVMTVFVSMDKMVGKDFEKGLAQLKELVEA
jgi:uncharacterized protein YndB with AHSA1/START domain